MALASYPILDANGVAVNLTLLDPDEVELITPEEMAERLASEEQARVDAYDAAQAATADLIAEWDAECAALRAPYDAAWAMYATDHAAWDAAMTAWEAGGSIGEPPPEPTAPSVPAPELPAPPEPVAPVYPAPPSPRWAPPPGHTIGPIGGQVGWTWDGATWTDPNAPSLADVKARRIAEAWRACDMLTQSGEVQVACAGGTYAFGTDRDTERNIQAVVVAVLAGIVPDPRPWTPRGEVSPIMVTNAELVTIGATIMARIDALVQAYLTHKAAILALGDAAAVAAYDIETGWPA